MMMTLQRLLFVLIAAVIVAALVPAGLTLERQLGDAIEATTRSDLESAPALVAERRRSISDAMMMHAKEIAEAPGLAAALVRGDTAEALRLVEEARGDYGEEAVLLTLGGRALAGVVPPAELIARTAVGEMPVEVVPDGGGLMTVGLAPVMNDTIAVAVAGVSVATDVAEAGALAALARSDILILRDDGALAAVTPAVRDTASLVSVVRALPDSVSVHEVTVAGRRYLLSTAPLGEYARVFFVRDMERERAVLGSLRETAAVSLGFALLLALLLGALFATRIARPVESLAAAADRLAAGDFHAPLGRSSLAEVRRMADAFDAMRLALAARLEELEAVNRELADRQARLVALQAELIQRDRLAATGQLVAQLAHEIRNPVANVRNCLELLRRRLKDDPEAREFADMAIDELLRMHEMAEQMLDLHRPGDAGVRETDLTSVARDVVALVRVGAPETLVVTVTGEDAVVAAVAPDSLKQVVLNLVQNAREATHEEGRIDLVVQRSGDIAVIEVRDDGPGIPVHVLPRVFDPFFTTKGDLHGVGLGLFVAEGIIRGFGGRITAANRKSGGARFRIELPPAATQRSGAEEKQA
jgi:signal transduction histidine kinase